MFLYGGGNALQRDLRDTLQQDAAPGTDGHFVEIVDAGVPAERSDPQDQQRHQQVKPHAGTPVDEILKRERDKTADCAAAEKSTATGFWRCTAGS